MAQKVTSFCRHFFSHLLFFFSVGRMKVAGRFVVPDFFSVKIKNENAKTWFVFAFCLLRVSIFLTSGFGFCDQIRGMPASVVARGSPASAWTLMRPTPQGPRTVKTMTEPDQKAHVLSSLA